MRSKNPLGASFVNHDCEHAMMKCTWTGRKCTQWTIFAAIIIAACLISFLRGQDANYDLLNYHFYNAWALFNHRYSQDYFVAGIQSYFDPVLDLPYYLLASGPLAHHPALLATLAGIPYGITLCLTYLLADNLVGRLSLPSARLRAVLVICCVALAGTGAATWSQVGTTTNELTTTVFALSAVLLFVRGFDANGDHAASYWRPILVGALLGLATGLKLTAAVYAPAMGVVVLLAPRSIKLGLRDAILYGAASAAVLLLSYGPWGWHLYQQTGNPFFPMFNDFFHSSWAAAAAWRDPRFFPKSLMQWLFYPFYWLGYNKLTVMELNFRDARFAAFYTVSALVLGVVLFRASRIKRLSAAWRPLFLLLAFTVMAYVIWLAMFSILRYAVVLEILVCILTLLLMVALGDMQFGRSSHLPSVVIAALLATALVAYARPPDWGHVAYGRSVFAADMPKVPGDAMVIFANQPMGFLAPMFAARQRDLSFSGMPSCFGVGQWCYKDFFDHDLGRAMRAALHAHAHNLHVAYYLNRVPSFPGLAAFGVVVDASNCQTITSNVSPDIRLCQAHLAGSGQHPVVSAYRLAVEVSTQPGVQLHVVWADNRCATETSAGTAKFMWDVAQPVAGSSDLFVRSPPGPQTLFAAGGQQGSAETGAWVQAGQEFTLRAHDGRELAIARMRYAPCTEK